MVRFLMVLAFVVMMAPGAHAYIGPGLGAGALAVVFGIVASLAIAFVAILWYPFKRLLRKRRPATPPTTERAEEAR